MWKKPVRFLAAMLALVLVVAGMPTASLTAVAASGNAANVEKIVIHNVSHDMDYQISTSTTNMPDYTLMEYIENEEEFNIPIGKTSVTCSMTSRAEDDGNGYEVTIDKPDSGKFPNVIYAVVYANAKDIETWNVTGAEISNAEAGLTNGGIKLSLNNVSTPSTTVEVTPNIPTPTCKITLPTDTSDFTVEVITEGDFTDHGDAVIVKQNQEFKFSITVSNETMEPSAVTAKKEDGTLVTVSPDTPASEENKYNYKIAGEDVTADCRISVRLKTKTVKVEIDGFNADSMLSNLDFVDGKYTNEAWVYGSSFSFMLSALDGYDAPKVTYSMGDTQDAVITPIGGTTYNINNVTKDLIINIKGDSDIATYAVSYIKNGTGYEATAKVLGEDGVTIEPGKTIEYGKTLEFTVTVNKNYNQSTPVITTSAAYTLSGPEDKDGAKVYTYTFENVKSAISITISGLTLNTYHVTLPTDTEKYTVSGNGATATATRNYVFTLTLADGYEYTGEKDNIVTTVTGATKQPVVQSENIYTVTLSDFTGDVTMEVDDSKITQKTFKVTKPPEADSNEDYTFAFVSPTTADKENVPYGSSVSFTVTPKDGKRILSVAYKTSESGAEIALQATGAQNNTYTVPSVQSNIWLVVHTEQIKYTVTYSDLGVGYTAKVTKGSDPIKSGDTVDAGSTVTLTIAVKEAYDPATLSVKVNGNTQSPNEPQQGSELTYTITVNANTTIDVTPPTAYSFEVTLPLVSTRTGYTITNESASTVGWDGTYKFTLTLNPGYQLGAKTTWETLVTLAEANGASIQCDKSSDHCVYTITNIKSNLTVQIGNPEKITFTVTKPQEDSSEFDFEFTSGGGTSVAWNGSVSFTVTPKPGYRVAFVRYKTSDGNVNLATTTGTNQYTIQNVTANYTIEVDCEPISVTITYKRNTVNPAGLAFSATDDTKVLNYRDNAGEFRLDGNKLYLKLPEETRHGFSSTGWMRGSSSVTEIEVVGTENQTYEVTRTYTVNWDGDDALISAKSVAMQTTDIGGGKTKVRWSARLTLNDQLEEADSSIVNAAIGNGTIKVKSCGMLFSYQQITNPKDYAEQIKQLSGAKYVEDGVVYSYVRNDVDSKLTLGNSYSLNVEISNTQQRWGVIWFVVTIAGEDHVFFGEQQAFGAQA